MLQSENTTKKEIIMKILELFAGSRSFSKVAEELGHETYTTDYEPFDKIDQVCDIRDFDEGKMREDFGMPDVIWASPPCTYFSVSSIGHHRNKDHTPKTKEAIKGVNIVDHTIYLISLLKPEYFYIENPRGKLRKLDVINKSRWLNIPLRRTVTYCSYLEKRMKPTDIWSNDWNWIPRQICFNGNRECHHEPAPRGSRTGTQGMDSAYEKSKVPKELCKEIIKGIMAASFPLITYSIVTHTLMV